MADVTLEPTLFKPTRTDGINFNKRINDLIDRMYQCSRTTEKFHH